jgi:lantibiotic modifying enzyme
LQSRITGADGLRAWPGPEGVPRPGFANGATGIAYALAHLFEQTHDEEFREAAFEGLAFERGLDVSGKQGWLDTGSNQTMDAGSWCYGAPGVALGRLGCLATMDEPALRQDLEDALRLTLSLPEEPNDQLCCGNFGRIDVLYTAGQALGRMRLIDHAQDWSKKIVQRAQSNGFLFVPPLHKSGSRSNQQFNPSLLLGAAGVGYTLLRLNHPDIFPSVLLLEPQK